jgi:hypothetical protein
MKMSQRHRASSDARDQAHLFDAPDGVVRQSGVERNVHINPANLPKSGECRIASRTKRASKIYFFVEAEQRN